MQASSNDEWTKYTIGVAHRVLHVLRCLLHISTRVRKVKGRDVEEAEQLALCLLGCVLRL